MKQAPYVAVQKQLGRVYPWMDCAKCHAEIPAQSRAAFRCGYLPETEWTGDGRPAYVHGSPVFEPSICPGYSVCHPKVREVADVWGWFKRGQMQLIHPHPSRILTELVSLFNEAMSGAESYMIRERADK